jgi:hypothetical protein
MHKVITFAAALILMGAAVWATKTSPRVDALTQATIYQLMTD